MRSNAFIAKYPINETVPSQSPADKSTVLDMKRNRSHKKVQTQPSSLKPLVLHSKPLTMTNFNIQIISDTVCPVNIPQSQPQPNPNPISNPNYNYNLYYDATKN